MPDKNTLAHDLTVIYLQNNFDENISPQELVLKYKETFKQFKDILDNEPKPKVKISDRRKYGL